MGFICANMFIYQYKIDAKATCVT